MYCIYWQCCRALFKVNHMNSNPAVSVSELWDLYQKGLIEIPKPVLTLTAGDKGHLCAISRRGRLYRIHKFNTWYKIISFPCVVSSNMSLLSDVSIFFGFGAKRYASDIEHFYAMTGGSINGKKIRFNSFVVDGVTRIYL